jgi:hypothetical protein
MDIKLRLLNKLEGTVQKANATQKDWREQAKRNQGELEAAKVLISIIIYLILNYTLILIYIYIFFIIEY